MLDAWTESFAQRYFVKAKFVCTEHFGRRAWVDPSGVMSTHLFFPEHDPVEEELQVLICIIDAKLLKAVEGQILLFPHKHTDRQTHTHISTNIW